MGSNICCICNTILGLGKGCPHKGKAWHKVGLDTRLHKWACDKCGQLFEYKPIEHGYMRLSFQAFYAKKQKPRNKVEKDVEKCDGHITKL